MDKAELRRRELKKKVLGERAVHGPYVWDTRSVLPYKLQ